MYFFISAFTEQGASSFCLSDTYAGPKSFSELETSSLSEYIKTVSSDLVSYISFHAYSQLLMVPYGHTKDHLDNYDEAVRFFLLWDINGSHYPISNIFKRKFH